MAIGATEAAISATQGMADFSRSSLVRTMGDGRMSVSCIISNFSNIQYMFFEFLNIKKIYRGLLHSGEKMNFIDNFCSNKFCVNKYVNTIDHFQCFHCI